MAIIQSNECMSIINNKLLTRKRIAAGKDLLQKVIIPTLTFGAETWSKLTEKEKNEINNVQTDYLTKLLEVPRTTPKCALLGSLELIEIEHIANTRKLQYYVDLQNRDESKLEVKMLKLQKSKNMSYEREINELKEKYKIEICLKGENPIKIKNYIKNEIKKINDQEIREKIKEGKKTKIMYEYNNKYIESLHYEEARAIFMMITRMIDVKANFKNKYRNIECEICKVEENTEHLSKCQKYIDLNEKIRGGTLQEILKINKEDDIAKIIKEIIKRKNNENKAENTRKKQQTPLP